MAAAWSQGNAGEGEAQGRLDGELLRYYDATVPILIHSLQYGSGIFEGVRAYETAKGTAVFRLDEHISRFLRSAKILSMHLNYTEKN